MCWTLRSDVSTPHTRPSSLPATTARSRSHSRRWASVRSSGSRGRQTLIRTGQQRDTHSDRALTYRQRPVRRPLARGSLAVSGTEHLVRRGLAERARGSYGVRPPVRAHDVPGLETRTGDGALRADREGRRLAERLDLAGPHELLRD